MANIEDFAQNAKKNGKTPRNGEGKGRANGEDENPHLEQPEILCGSGDHARATEDALKILAAEPDPLAAVYVRGDMLMRPIRLAQPVESGGVKRPEGALVLRQADTDWLRLHLGRRALWWKWRKGTKDKPEKQPIDPPDRVCRNVLADAPWPGIPVLSGVIEAPTVLPNGRVIQEAGYDRRSGLLFDPGKTVFPRIKDEPGRLDACEALVILQEPFAKFPFVDDISKSVALSAVLTVLTRRILRLAPMFAFDAPTRSSGKTLLASCMGMIATGRNPAIMSHIADPAEERKRLLSLLIEGMAAVLIDNVETTFRSEAMNVILTSDVFSDRLLGVSRTVNASTNCMFMASGNNIVIGGDLSTRALLCQIDPGMEDPDQRPFDVDLPTWLPENRGKIASAAITIIKAYLADGAKVPKDVPNYGRFKEWQRMCRFPLIWLGLPDPCESRQKILGEDPDAGNLKALLEAWRDLFGDDGLTVSSAVSRCIMTINEAKGAESGYGVPSETRDISKEETFMEVAKNIAFVKGALNNLRLARFISTNARRIAGGLRFEKADVICNTVQWRVAKVGR